MYCECRPHTALAHALTPYDIATAQSVQYPPQRLPLPMADAFLDLLGWGFVSSHICVPKVSS